MMKPSCFPDHLSVGCSHLVERPGDHFFSSCWLPTPYLPILPDSWKPPKQAVHISLNVWAISQRNSLKWFNNKQKENFNVRIQEDFCKSVGVSVSTCCVTNNPTKKKNFMGGNNSHLFSFQFCGFSTWAGLSSVILVSAGLTHASWPVGRLSRGYLDYDSLSWDSWLLLISHVSERRPKFVHMTEAGFQE